MKDCNQCGKCCINYANGGLSALTEEIDWWDTHRPDIAAYAKDGKIWISPETGEQLSSCPFLEKLPGQEKYTCQIYFDRPNDCKYYPVNIEQMVQDDCEMLERRDLADLKKAQRNLDKLMSDSRPPLD
jgi:Fe-S-cluster containining protein